MKVQFDYLRSPYGMIRIEANEQYLLAVQFVNEVDSSRLPKNRIIEAAKNQLEEYFVGSRTDFDLPLPPMGEKFVPKVWRELQKIPFGETRTYGEVAKSLKSPRAARAVGMACHNNPLLIVVPCHRVLAAGGGLGGFALDINIKKNLLSHEKTNIPK